MLRYPEYYFLYASEMKKERASQQQHSITTAWSSLLSITTAWSSLLSITTASSSLLGNHQAFIVYYFLYSSRAAKNQCCLPAKNILDLSLHFTVLHIETSMLSLP